MKRKGLGKGLESIFADNYTEKTEATGGEGVSKIKLSQIEVKSDQPRKYFDTEALEVLADSISQHGVLQPILVRRVESGFYQIIAGERRFRASKMAGLSEIPVIIMDKDDRKAAEIIEQANEKAKLIVRQAMENSVELRTENTTIMKNLESINKMISVILEKGSY